MKRFQLCTTATAVAIAALTTHACADPCGMVPPITTGNDAPIARVGDQNTYVFFKDGVETFVIRPGFEGNVDEFGMLIPFPSVPSLRKVSDNAFPHVRAAIDPPEVVVHVARFERFRKLARSKNAPSAPAEALGALAFNEVRVVKQEAVGMYEIAVLEAGSSQALKKWMDDHGYKYPEGMDVACNEYVESGWCFVAVKTKVGQKKGVDPRPGMRTAQPQLPAGSTFDGHVQAMGFRFKTDELVVPMRLSTFNEGDLHNIVYVLTDDPVKLRSVPEEYVVRQIPGETLKRHVTEPLPLRIIGGTLKDLAQWQKQNLPQQRDPKPHNGAARDLFASDVLAVKEGRLSHLHEEQEKMLLRIGEALSLRGPEIDTLNEGALETERDKTAAEGLDGLKGMTLSVIDGNFPRQILANQNLKFANYQMPARRNNAKFYDAKTKKPAPQTQGVVEYGKVSATTGDAPQAHPLTQAHPLQWVGLRRCLGVGALSCVMIGLMFTLRRRSTMSLIIAACVAATTPGLAHADDAKSDKEPAKKAEKSEEKPKQKGAETEATKKHTTLELIDQLADPKKADDAAQALIARGEEARPHLLGEALEGNDLAMRGWAIVCLSEIGGKDAEERLAEIHKDGKQPALVRTWAAAGLVNMSDSSKELLAHAQLIPQFPALGRPIGLKLVAKLNEKGDEVTAEDLLNVTITVPQLQQSLAPAIMAQGADKLVTAMTTAKDQNVRRQAAAYLGTLANKGEDAVPGAVVNAYKFDPQAKKVAWDGGPLFIPGIKWEKDDARALVGNLISWFVWTEENAEGGTKSALQQQLHNNLRSLQLASAAGYQSPGFQQAGVDAWLSIWGKAVGKEKLTALLKKQGVADKDRYKKIIDAL